MGKAGESILLLGRRVLTVVCSIAGCQRDICYVFIAIVHSLSSNSHSLWLSSKLLSLHVYLSKSSYTWWDRIRTFAPAQSQERSEPENLQLTKNARWSRDGSGGSIRIRVNRWDITENLLILGPEGLTRCFSGKEDICRCPWWRGQKGLARSANLIPTSG